MHKKRKQKFLLLFAQYLDECGFFHSIWNTDTIFKDKLLSFIHDASVSCICITAGARSSFMLKKGTGIIPLKSTFSFGFSLM